MRNKTIAILGGMGPDASAYMYKFLITMAQKEFGVKNNNDYPEIILYSLPVPDFISSKNNKKIALEMLMDRIIKLNDMNVAYLSLACNTAHILLRDLEKVSKVSFISMIDKVVEKVNKAGLKKIGILGTPTTLNSKLYQKALSKHGIESVIPNNAQVNMLNKIIRNVLAGKINKKDKIQLIDIADSLNSRGVEGVILGCTELPLVFPLKYSIPVYNSVEILSMALLRKYYKSNTID